MYELSNSKFKLIQYSIFKRCRTIFGRVASGDLFNFEVWAPKWKIKKHVNGVSRIASSPISQSFCFEEIFCLIFASSQGKLRGYLEFLKFHVMIKKIKKFKFV